MKSPLSKAIQFRLASFLPVVVVGLSCDNRPVGSARSNFKLCFEPNSHLSIAQQSLGQDPVF